jgi:hypothetical protein
MALANPEEVTLLDELEAGGVSGDGAPLGNPEEVALPDEVDDSMFDAPAPRAAPTWKAPPRHLLVRRSPLHHRQHMRTAHTQARAQVLDVNGLLIERSMAALCDAHNVPVEADQRVGAFHIYNRPGLHAFVSMLLERFVVGVWSSARQHNLRGMVRHIFGAHEDRLAFVWGQEACSYAGTSAKKKPLFLKELGRLWTEPAFAPFGPHNTLLVDDDAYKAARNPPHTAIHPAKVRRASEPCQVGRAAGRRRAR